MRHILGATRDAFDIVAAPDRRREGQPGYRVKPIPGQAQPRPDFKARNLSIARPLFPKGTGGPYWDPFGTLDGTTPRAGVQGTSRQTIKDWEYRQEDS